MKKKAQGMSLNVIIIAVLGLLVLVILALVFTGRTGIFVKQVESCQGQCVNTNADCTGTYAKVTTGSCPGPDAKPNTADDQVCCVQVTG